MPNCTWPPGRACSGQGHMAQPCWAAPLASPGRAVLCHHPCLRPASWEGTPCSVLGLFVFFFQVQQQLMGFAASIPSPASWSVFIHFQKVPLGGYPTACQPSLVISHALFAGGGCVSGPVRGAGPGAAHPGHAGNSCSMCSDSTGFRGLRPLNRPHGIPAEPAPQRWSSLSCWLLGFRPFGGEWGPRDGLSAQVTLSGVVSVGSALPCGEGTSLCWDSCVVKPFSL